MERITHKGADGRWYQDVNFEGDILECLAAYEDTGLTPEEIERLRKCFDKGVYLPSDILQAADAIETTGKLEHENLMLRTELNRLKRERDQAVKDLRHKDVCDICIGSLNELEGCDCECLDCKLECRCRNCIDESLWQWRGVQEENNEQIDF